MGIRIDGRLAGAWRPLLLALAALVVIPALGHAQGGPGFLFRQPTLTLTLRAGYAVPTVSSDVFADGREFLTLERSDFHALSFGGDVMLRVSDRVDLGGGMNYTASEVRSEFRDWVGADDLPIVQDTRFTRLPVTLNARFFLTDRGRSIGRFAWVPTTFAPYLGGGAGAMRYSYSQIGEFVDYQTIDETGADIFYDALYSEGWTATVHGMAGADLTLTPRLVLNGEARYYWAAADMDLSSFEGFDPIDLAGFQATVGLSIRF
jgi:hypothetical protein